MKETILKLLVAATKHKAAHPTETLTLNDALTTVDRSFGCDRLLKEFDNDFTVPYYTQSELGYRFYHSEEDAVHMALNFDGVFHPDGYQAQPRIVAEQIEQLRATQVLEVGCGKGFNSLFLAQKYPHVKFTGVDLTPSHIAIANQKIKTLTNLNFQVGNFNDLNFPSQSFDVVFACECLCHSHQPPVTLTELFRLLRPGGKLVVFDGYRQAKLAHLSQSMQMAIQLVEIGMAVRQGFSNLEEWTTTVQHVGFVVETRADLTCAIQPTLLRLQSLSKFFFQSLWRSKLLALLLPKYLVRNAVSGLLMPFACVPDHGPLGYYKFVLRRE